MGCSILFVAVLMLSGCFSALAAGTAKKWWQNAIIYEIYPQSFYDKDGDGLGDLAGIQDKATYLQDIGVNAIWIAPFFKSPGKDNGYDVSDYKDIDPRYGKMFNFEQMVKTYNQLSMEVILDFVPNHSSDQHEWFRKSIQKIEPYTDYYIWKDPKKWVDDEPVPPNNWASMFKSDKPGSAWKWNEERQQYYYHTFMVEQPDLNLRNPKVVQELKDILKFWVDKGVKGFRFDAVPHLFEDKDLKENGSGLSVEYTQNLPETYALIQDFRAYLDSLGKSRKTEYFMTVEAYCGQEQTLKYYGTTRKRGAHFPFNFLLLTELNGRTNAYSLNKTISTYLSKLNEFQHPNWVTGNHDWARIKSRMGTDVGVDSVMTIAMLLPGVVTVYYGDEIGMDSYWDMDQSQCPAGVAGDYRTPNRTPFQWSYTKHAGFTTATKPWIPVNPDYVFKNVKSQDNVYMDPPTPLIRFKQLAKQRKHPAFTDGNIRTYVFDENVFGFTRKYKNTLFVIVINLNGNVGSHLRMAQKIPDLKEATLIDTPFTSNHYADKCQSRSACAKHFTSPDHKMPAGSSFVLRYKLPSKRLVSGKS